MFLVAAFCLASGLLAYHFECGEIRKIVFGSRLGILAKQGLETRLRNRDKSYLGGNLAAMNGGEFQHWNLWGTAAVNIRGVRIGEVCRAPRRRSTSERCSMRNATDHDTHFIRRVCAHGTSLQTYWRDKSIGSRPRHLQHERSDH